MFDKKKVNFWRLAFIFASITIIILFFLWISPYEPKSQMMNSSMGNMAKNMHLSNITIYDLLGGPEMSQGMKDMSSHHTNISSAVINMSFLTTSIIFILIPLIIGGSIILTIMWIK